MSSGRPNREPNCPLDCRVTTRTLRQHVYLSPVFHRGVLTSREISTIRERILKWLARTLRSPDAFLLELSSTLRTEELLTWWRLRTACAVVGGSPSPCLRVVQESASRMHLLHCWFASKHLATSDRLRDYSMKPFSLRGPSHARVRPSFSTLVLGSRFPRVHQ